MTTVYLIGRVIFGLYFAYSGLNHFLNGKGMVGYAAFKKVPMPALAVYGSGLLILLGGLGVVFEMYIQISLVLIIVFLVPVTFFMHDFWKDTDPQSKISNKINFQKNLALIGAALMLLGL